MSLAPLLGSNGPVPFVGEREVLSRHGLTLDFTLPCVPPLVPLVIFNVAGCMLQTATVSKLHP